VVLVPLKGVHVVRAKTKAGVVEYHYAWRKGPRLPGKPGTQEYLSAYYLAHQSRKQPNTGTLREILIKFKASPEFGKLSGHTARAYRRYLDMIEAEFGDLPTAALNDPGVRTDFLEWRDGMAANPRTADYAVGTLKRVLEWAKERVLVHENQAAPIGRLHSADRSDSIWSDTDFENFGLHASKELVWAVRLASYTGLRQSDLIRLPWSAFDGQSFAWRTSKRKKDVLIPATPGCAQFMADIDKRGPLILTTERGKRPWTADGLRSSFRTARKAAGVKRTFHDLRRTACTRLLAHGDMTDGQLALMFGWSEADIQALKRKYVSRSAVAEAMLAKFGKGG
jgi:integrase